MPPTAASGFGEAPAGSAAFRTDHPAALDHVRTIARLPPSE
ncbi:MAG TPA: hypothetical protein VKD72_29430 [Gemmataceae bacterium]|nr:hypothetical protein [Gemmataceae bacterium]